MRYMYTGPVSVYSRPGLRPLTLVSGRVYDLCETEPRLKGLVARGYLRAAAPIQAPPSASAKPAKPPPTPKGLGHVSTADAVKDTKSKARKESDA